MNVETVSQKKIKILFILIFAGVTLIFDLALYDKLDVTSLIDKIVNLESKYEFIKDNELDKRFISKTLKVPEYQVKLLFAYHNF